MLDQVKLRRLKQISSDGDWAAAADICLPRCQKRLERFNSDRWKGSRLTPETVLEVSLVGHDQRNRVTVERVRKLSRERLAP